MEEARITDFYKLMKEADEIFYRVQKHSNISEAEYWCLMAVRTDECHYQHEISRFLHVSRQTVNSALKQLVTKGLIELRGTENNHKIKKIIFTDQGNRFANQFIDIVNDAENRAWNQLTLEERNQLVGIIRKLNDHLEDEMRTILNNKH